MSASHISAFARRLTAPVALLSMMGGCSLFQPTGGRGPVSLEGWEAVRVTATQLGVEVPSCNGDPILDQLVEEEAEIRIRVVTDLPGPGPQDACLDSIQIRLEKPLADHRLVDAVSGAEIPVRD